MSSFVTFPGTTGRYAARTDVNLLDADTAHLHQSAGTFAGWGTGAAAPVLSTLEAAQGIASSNVGRLTTSSHTIGCIYPGVPSTTVGVVVTPGEVYSYGRWVKFDAAITESKLDFRFVNGTGGYSGNSFIEVANTGEWQWVSHTATVPANSARMGVTIQDPNSESTGRVGYISAGVLRAGSTTTFVPSLRIVSNDYVEMDVVLADWTPAAAMVLWDDGATKCTLNTAGTFTFEMWGAASSALSPTTPLVDGTRYTISVEGVRSTGVMTFKINGVTQTAPTLTPTTPTYSNLYVASDTAGANNLAGDVYTLTRRDGISGPTVARFSGADVLEAVT